MAYQPPAEPPEGGEPENEPSLLGADPMEEFAGIARDIEEACQRKLAGLRRLPRRFRAAARNQALEERRMGLSALAQKKAAARDHERRLRLNRRPVAGPHISPL